METIGKFKTHGVQDLGPNRRDLALRRLGEVYRLLLGLGYEI